MEKLYRGNKEKEILKISAFLKQVHKPCGDLSCMCHFPFRLFTIFSALRNITTNTSLDSRVSLHSILVHLCETKDFFPFGIFFQKDSSSPLNPHYKSIYIFVTTSNN